MMNGSRSHNIKLNNGSGLTIIPDGRLCRSIVVSPKSFMELELKYIMGFVEEAEPPCTTSSIILLAVVVVAVAVVPVAEVLGLLDATVELLELPKKYENIPSDF